MATVLECLDGLGPVSREYYHPVYQTIRSSGQSAEPRALMIYWTRPFLAGETPHCVQQHLGGGRGVWVR